MFPKSIFYMLAITIFFPTLSFSATLYVGEGETYKTIQSAVDAANEGDEIIVKAGEYRESVEIRKTVSIYSESGYTSTTVIRDEHSYDPAFDINAKGVRIEGFHIYIEEPWSYSVHQENVGISVGDQCLIANNLITCQSVERSDVYGILLEYSRNSIIRDNHLISNGTGVGLLNSYSGEGSIITQNTFTNNQYGVSLERNTSGNYIYQNTFIENQKNFFIDPNSKHINYSLHAPKPVVYLYKGQQFKTYLGNYYKNHDPSGNTNNGISEQIYNYPYHPYQPYDQYALLASHDHYKNQTLYLSSNLQLSSQIEISSTHINKGESLIWRDSQAAQTNTTYEDIYAWKGDIQLDNDVAPGPICKIEVGFSSNQSDFVSGGLEIEIVGEQSLDSFAFETSKRKFTVYKNHFLAMRISNLHDQAYDIVYGNLKKPPIQILPPSIYSLNPIKGHVYGATTVTITGSDFGNQQGDGEVIFGNVNGEIKEWSDSTIICSSPANASGFVTITVITDSRKQSNKNNAFLYYHNDNIVGSDETLTCIQDAIYYANSGDTIIVRKGLYHENIFVYKPITIQSESGWESTTIIAKNNDTSVIDIVSDNVTIQGFTIYGATENYAAGIHISAPECAYCTLMNNVCGVSEDKNNCYGIRLYNILYCHDNFYRYGYSHIFHNHVITGNLCYYNSISGISGVAASKMIIKDNCLSFNNNNGLSLYYSCYESYHFVNSRDSNLIVNNEFIANKKYGLSIGSNNNLIYQNNFINNQESNIQLLSFQLSISSIQDNGTNQWFSEAPVYYEYNGKSYKNRIGNYFSDHDLSDNDNNGITDACYNIFPGNHIDQCLSKPIEHYHTQIWNLTDKHLVETSNVYEGGVTINKGQSHMWTTVSPTTADLMFQDAHVWSGQLCISETPAQGTVFLIEIGVSKDGQDLISYGEIEIDAFEKGTRIPFLCHASDFTVPKGQYIALRITNYSGYNYVIQTGLFNSSLSKPVIRYLADIFTLEPEISPTSGYIKITISGSGFGESRGNQKVMFGNVPASYYYSWTHTQIKCSAPKHSAQRVDVWIKKENQTGPTGLASQFVYKDDVLFVGKDAMYPSIQSAVSAANYSDTIIVRDGIYHENIKVNKPLSIRSENGNAVTTIMPLDSSDPVIELYHDNCLVDGFTIYGCTSEIGAIRLSGDHCKLMNNRIGLNEKNANIKGIWLYDSNDSQVINNLVQYNEIGIELDYSHFNQIINNTCSYQTNVGIYAHADKNIFSENICQYNIGDGFILCFDDNIILNNEITSNGNNGIQLAWSERNTLFGNRIMNNSNYGIHFSEDINVTFYNNIAYNTHNAYSSDDSIPFNSPIKLYYIYNNNLKFNFLGNSFTPFFSSDLNNDGLCDEAYPIHDNNRDNFPLYVSPDQYNLQVWALQTDHRILKQFTNEIGQIAIKPEMTQQWKAVAKTFMITEHSQFQGQLTFDNYLRKDHTITIRVGYINAQNIFVPLCSGISITGIAYQYEEQFYVNGDISPDENSFEKALAIQIVNNGSRTVNILTGGAWSYFSFAQGNNNQPPVASDDIYIVSKGDSITIDAPGILHNDSDPENEDQTIIILENVKHGTLTLNPNGGFTYKHNGNDIPSDRFTYKTNDGSMDALQSATVTLSFLHAPVIKTLPDRLTSNTSYQITISSTGNWIEYQLDNTNWQRYNDAFEVSNQGNHTILARVKKDDDWIYSNSFSFTIDQASPESPNDLSSQPEQGTCGENALNIQWTSATDGETNIEGYSVLLDNQPESIPDKIVETTGLSWFNNHMVTGKEYYFHIASVDAAGNVSNPIHAGPYCVNLNYEINALAGAHGQIIPEGTLSVQQGSNQTFQFKPESGYIINQVLIDNVPVAIDGPEYTFTAIDKNHHIEVTFYYSSPQNVIAVSEKSGVKLKWHDKTINKEVAGYHVYRSPSQEEPFLSIDPISLNREIIGEEIWYQVFDVFHPRDIQQQSTFWYRIAAVMFDGSFGQLSQPVEGHAQIVSGGSFRLVPIQEELEVIPGKNALFNFYVIAEGNFKDLVDLTASYPSSQSKPEGVSWEFTLTPVTPLASVGLLIKTGLNASLGTYDIDINATGGERSDQLRLGFSIIPEDEENTFISAHIKQQSVELNNRMDINGFISVRKDEKLDIYGKTLPSQEGTPVTIFIQYENQPYMEIQAITNADGTYLKSFTPEAVGTYRIYAQYINQHNTTVDSQSISFSARKSNQSVVQCHTEDKEIEQGDIVSIFTQLFPNLENEKIHFQIKKPDSSFTSYRISTDSQGKCDFNIALSEKGTWEIRAWWEGNDAYEGQYSKPLYLHPGIKTPRALIIAGGGIESNNMRETTKYLANRFYKLLIGRRLKDHSIHYMSSVENESNAFIDDTNPTENKIAEYLKSLYKNKPYDVDPETSLIIYLVDHGGYNSFQINSKDFLYADQFSQYLDALQEKTNCKVQLIIEACKSGSFMDELTQANIQNRIIITATGDNVLSYYDQDGRESFSSHLFNWLIQGFSLGESFSNASSMLRKKPKTYGDQVPEVNNLNIAKETYLGGTFLTGDRMPVFTAHTPNQVIDNQKLTITEKIEDEDADCTVWASIMPPNHHISYFDPSTTPQWQLETVNLRPKPGHKHFYEATYECFYQKGVYVVTVYAEDSAGNISSEEILVTVNESQLPPGWGNMDNNAIIDLQDAIIALKILCQMPLTSINLENQLCNHKVSLEEVIYIFQMIMD